MNDKCSSNEACSEPDKQSCNTDGKKQSPKNSFRVELNSSSSVKHVIGVVSGKGGVGKSLVTSLLATSFSKKGYKTAVLDADITGPSIPKMFGITGKAEGNHSGLLPKQTSGNIGIMSINLLLDTEETPVVWRGPLIANTVKQF